MLGSIFAGVATVTEASGIFALVARELGGDELIESALNGLGLGPYALVAVVPVLVFLLVFFIDWNGTD